MPRRPNARPSTLFASRLAQAVLGSLTLIRCSVRPERQGEPQKLLGHRNMLPREAPFVGNRTLGPGLSPIGTLRIRGIL